MTRRSPLAGRSLPVLLAVLAWHTSANAADLFTDFSATNNPNGAWTYGHAASPGASFSAYSLAAASNLDGVHAGLQGWSVAAATAPVLGINHSGSLIDDGNVSLPTGVVLLHGQGVGPGASEVRWAAPQAGAYQVTASFTGYQRNMQAKVAVFNGNSSLYGNSIAGLGGSASFSAVVNLLAGDALTFAVNRDAADPGGFAGNWTGLALSITAVPEPQAWSLMFAGMAGLGFAARRRGRASV